MEKLQAELQQGMPVGDVRGGIVITDATDRVVVFAGGVRIADSTRSKILSDSKHPPVRYIPQDDVDMAFLEKSAHGSVCPYKGDCSYFDIVTEGGRMRNVVWRYATPHAVAAAIAGALAFVERVGQGDGVTMEITSSNARI